MSDDVNIEFIEYWLEKGLTMDEIEEKMNQFDCDDQEDEEE